MTPTPPALRLKSSWFRPGEARSPEEQAGAMGFIVFRVAHQMLKRMRGARFDIDIGMPYFAFLAEVLQFGCVIADRLAHARLGASERAAFTVALVHHVARHLAENQTEYLGPPAGDRPSYEARFVDQFNELATHYAEFGADPSAPPEAGFLPDFAMLRYFASRLEPVLPEKDRHWVRDQVIAIEAPEIVELLQRAMRQLHDPTPRRARRASLNGE